MGLLQIEIGEPDQIIAAGAPMRLRGRLVDDDVAPCRVLDPETIGHAIHQSLQRGECRRRLEDLLVCAQPAAVGHRLMPDPDLAPIVEKGVPDLRDRSLLGRCRQQQIVIRIRRTGADGGAALEDLAQRGAGLRIGGLQPVDLPIARIAKHEPLPTVENANALRDLLEDHPVDLKLALTHHVYGRSLEANILPRNATGADVCRRRALAGRGVPQSGFPEHESPRSQNRRQ